MKRGAGSWIVALSALNVAAWGSEGLGLFDGGPPVVLERAAADVPHSGVADVGLRASQRAPNDRTAATGPAPQAANPARRADPATAPADFHAWIADLADDDVRNNASHAFAQLTKCDDRIVPLLHAALDSPDRQQRHLAADLLRARDAEPTQRLFELTLEALRVAGEWAEERRSTIGAHNGGHAASYLLRHLPAVTERLVSNLGSDDPGERFLSAYVLGGGRVARGVQRTCEVLIGHLEHNALHGDARMSADALHALGPLARPYLLFAEPHADEQAHELLLLLQYDDMHDSSSPAQRRERNALHEAAAKHYDPLDPAAPEVIMEHNPPARWGIPQQGC
jgi:hypothetical protein